LLKANLRNSSRQCSSSTSSIVTALKIKKNSCTVQFDKGRFKGLEWLVHQQQCHSAKIKINKNNSLYSLIKADFRDSSSSSTSSIVTAPAYTTTNTKSNSFTYTFVCVCVCVCLCVNVCVCEHIHTHSHTYTHTHTHAHNSLTSVHFNWNVSCLYTLSAVRSSSSTVLISSLIGLPCLV